jgi:hypothetical protein
MSVEFRVTGAGQQFRVTGQIAMPVGIIPQRNGSQQSTPREGDRSLRGRFALSLAQSVGVYGRIPRADARSSSTLSTPRQPSSGRPPSRSSRTPTFNERERAIISNLDDFSAVQLAELNARLYASRLKTTRNIRSVCTGISGIPFISFIQA